MARNLLTAVLLQTIAASGKGAEKAAEYLKSLDQQGSLPGVVPVGVVFFNSNPLDGENITLGGDIIGFAPSGGSLIGGATIAVEIGATLADTITNLLAAINGTAANPHPTITDGVGDPAAGVITELFVAENSAGGFVEIMPTETAPGGSPYPVVRDKQFSVNLSDGSSYNNADNFNKLGGADPLPDGIKAVALEVLASHITGGLKFKTLTSPVGAVLQVRTSAGVIRGPGTDTLTIGADYIEIGFGGAGAPDIQATDILTLIYW